MLSQIFKAPERIWVDVERLRKSLHDANSAVCDASKASAPSKVDVLYVRADLVTK